MEKIAWIGYSNANLAQATVLEDDIGVKVDKLFDAGKGIEAVKNIQYCSIIVQDTCPAGNANVPSEMLRTPYGAACYVIGQIREGINKETPVLVHLIQENLTPKKNYLGAGATGILDRGQIKNYRLDYFVNEVKGCLKFLFPPVYSD